MRYKDLPKVEFEYVPATRYGLPGLIAIPVREIDHVFGYSLKGEFITGLRLKTGEVHGTHS